MNGSTEFEVAIEILRKLDLNGIADAVESHVRMLGRKAPNPSEIQVRLSLGRGEFQQLVQGKEVVFDGSERPRVTIILSDIGLATMKDAVDEAGCVFWGNEHDKRVSRS